MIEHERLVRAASQAIDQVFSDTQVPVTQTRKSLEQLQGEIELKLETLPEEE